MTENTAQGPRYFGRDGFEWAGNTAIHELGPVVVRRTAGGDQVQAILKDSLGSTVSTVSSVANRRSYDAFGAARNADYSPRPNGTLNLPATIHGFTGHTHADDVALIHMGGRIYDPNLGRFLSTDPIIQNLADGQSINPYSYVLNNPFSGRDPTGYTVTCHDNKTCGMPDAPTQDEQQWKKSGPLLPKSNGADGLTAKGPQSQPVDGSATDIGTTSKTINGLSVTQLEGVTVTPTAEDWDFARRQDDAAAFILSPAALAIGIATGTNPWQRNEPGDDSISQATLPGAWAAATKGIAIGVTALRTTAKAGEAFEVIDSIPSSALRGDSKSLQTYYPPNNGFDGEAAPFTLLVGTKVDRYGGTGGSFLSPQGTPPWARALPFGAESRALNLYEVIRPFEVNAGRAAPWFNQPGGGVQYDLGRRTVQDLIDGGYLRPQQ